MKTKDLNSYNYVEYNRRTTDYGNGRIEIAAYHKPRFRHLGSAPSGRESETSDEAQEKRTRHQIYTKDPETGILTQTDDNCLIIAKEEHRKNAPATETAAKTGRKGEGHEKDYTHPGKSFLQ